MTIARRRFLGLVLTSAPLIGVLASTSARAATCYDPAALPLSQKNRRRSLGYMEVADDPAKRCAGCAFFTATAEECGQCAMLSSTVNSGASCGSFAPRPNG
ncbi:hypothetical protein ABVV53_10315 [Novosphingobium sp. RD2P27]|uniref:High-potential iron-sulfur protein n=1 Tax=Novosphingobium kalidii TaxID=3230299 RepID=A0ABV2D1Y6_9SPHN